jgi:hypothetical protein
MILYESVLYWKPVLDETPQNNWLTIILNNFFPLKVLNIEEVNLIVDYN